ncbi:MAG TPA: hypothetical protein VGG37_01780 [Opitutaceae bacterium]|jgi:hypothetical protein
MLERRITALETDDAGTEAAERTRERLKAAFPPGATRRMTSLGMLVGAALGRVAPAGEDVVYASAYAESRALEAFLDTFPTPSPTLFQTSIQPSAVQQLLIARQVPVAELLPVSGGELLAFHALRAALTSPSPRLILCGGEERGTWLREHGLASERTFGFAARLESGPGVGIAVVRLLRSGAGGHLGLPSLFDALHARADIDAPAAPGWRLQISWTR